MLTFRRSEAFSTRSVFVRSDERDLAFAVPPPLRTIYSSTSGLNFEVRPEYLEAIISLIARVRSLIADAKANGRLTAYLSVPISPRGGGHPGTNNAIAFETADGLTRRFGSGLTVINSAAFNLPKLDAKGPEGGEYMAVWSDILAGADGKGDVFDMVYFVGPADVWSFFKLQGSDIIGGVNAWVDKKSSEDPEFKQYIETDNHRIQFVRYYALRGSVAYSKGAHDEWNIVAALNSKREIGDDIAVYFDGRPIEPGDYADLIDPGYRV